MPIGLARCFAGLILLLAGCAVATAPPPAHIAGAAGAGGPLHRGQALVPRLWYVGIGLYGESWSENDVADVATELQHTASYRVVPYVFSNRGRRDPDRLPLADRRGLERTTRLIAERADPNDVVLVYISTHGAPGLLGRSTAGRELPPVGLDELREWLAPLRAQNTVLVLSACFSGSLIPGLRADNRIIFTASRADRTSFGCRPGAQHTVFGEAFLRALAEPHESLESIIARTRDSVARRERTLGVAYPSDPQLYVGAAVEPLIDAQIF